MQRRRLGLRDRLAVRDRKGQQGRKVCKGQWGRLGRRDLRVSLGRPARLGWSIRGRMPRRRTMRWVTWFCGRAEAGFRWLAGIMGIRRA